MKVIIAGSTGMIGGLILEECINSGDVAELVNVTRKPYEGKPHDKLNNVQINNFETYDEKIELFKNIDVAFFCLGAYTGKVDDKLFKQITVDYAVGFAAMLHRNSPNARLCLLSGAGADRSESSRMSFAKYKGMAENQISALGLSFYAFRPGYIYPETPRKEPNLMYVMMRWLYPILRFFGSKNSIKSTALAKAMYSVGMKGAEKEILENDDILKVAEQ